jgi:aspartate/methionine/tyrosine aminotransferase
MGLSCVRPDGAFYAFPSIRKLGLTSEEFCTRAIQEAGVALVPGSIFGAEGHVRLSYACDSVTLRRGLDRLESFVSGH